MQTAYSYAKMEEKDLEEVVTIEQGVFRHPWSEGFFRLILQDHNNWIITLRRETTLLGYGGYHLLKKRPSFLPLTVSSNGIIHLINIAINPSFQHQGLGTQLLDIAAEMSSDAGFTKLSVISAVGTRTYYRERGFSEGDLYRTRPL